MVAASERESLNRDSFSEEGVWFGVMFYLLLGSINRLEGDNERLRVNYPHLRQSVETRTSRKAWVEAHLLRLENRKS